MTEHPPVKTRVETRLSWWPSLHDYNDAIQIPRANLQDPDLKVSIAYTDTLGLPRPVTGSFACVYRMHCDQRDFALRLFLRSIHDRTERYALLSEYLQEHDLIYTVPFTFLNHGIKSRGDWHPALKMEWIDGQAFDDYVFENLNNPDRLHKLAADFTDMMKTLQSAGVAHGDLQHGNIIITDEKMHLVDYDGMFVPAMKGFVSNELGHPNYQHPQRSAIHFGPYLDNFSAWVTYTSIKALALDAKLWKQLGGGDDCLLFRRTDFLDPLNSPAFAALEQHENEDLQSLGVFLRSLLTLDVTQIPHLQIPLPDLKSVELESLPSTASAHRSGPRLIRSSTSEWLQNENLKEITGEKRTERKEKKQSDSILKSHNDSIDIKQRAPATWIKPGGEHYSPSSPTTLRSLLQMGNSVYFVPPELVTGPIPRKVQFDCPDKNNSPEIYQWWMILNPVVWLMLYFFFTGVTVDNDLKLHGVKYAATLTDLKNYQTAVKTSVVDQADMQFSYKVGGKTYLAEIKNEQNFRDYVVGHEYPIIALQSDPNIHEPVGSESGTRQTNDLYVAFLCLLPNLLLECFIWFGALSHRHLARTGIPAIARVESLMQFPQQGQRVYKAVLQVQCKNKSFEKTIFVTKEQYETLTENSTEVVLCDPTFPQQLVLYRFCKYRPVY